MIIPPMLGPTGSRRLQSRTEGKHVQNPVTISVYLEYKKFIDDSKILEDTQNMLW